MHSETLCKQITSGDVSGCVAFCLVNRQEGGERLSDETSGFEQKGVMQSTGTDFKQTLAVSENCSSASSEILDLEELFGQDLTDDNFFSTNVNMSY